jgi:hypothetical protein
MNSLPAMPGDNPMKKFKSKSIISELLKMFQKRVGKFTQISFKDGFLLCKIYINYLFSTSVPLMGMFNQINSCVVYRNQWLILLSKI